LITKVLIGNAGNACWPTLLAITPAVGAGHAGSRDKVVRLLDRGNDRGASFPAFVSTPADGEV
jgi:hypothetical protein